jgi:DNA replication protein DnaC
MERQTAALCMKCGATGIRIEPAARAEARLCECAEHCPICHGARFVFEKDKARRDLAHMCDCERRRIRIRLFNEAGVPGKFADARLDDRFRDTRNRKVTEAFDTFRMLAKEYQRGQQGILLMGPSGVGKTFLVAAFIHEVIFRHGIPAHFRDFFHLLADLRSGYSQDKPESELIQPLVDVEVLVIDELGKGRNTAWEQNILDVIISQRYNNRKTTVFTSNYTDSRQTTLAERVRSKDAMPGEGDAELRDTLRERVGPRIYSRLREMCHFVEMAGPDRRELEGELRPA